MKKMSKETKNADKQQSDDKPLTEIEYLEYMSKKAKTIHTITYPDGSKGELNRGAIVLL